MFKALLALLLTSTLHAQSMGPATFEKKMEWSQKPLLSVEELPIKNESPENIEVSAVSALAIDLSSGKILYEKNTNEKRQIASLTKLMTGLIIAEEEPDHTITEISENATQMEGSIIWLNKDEEITVLDLIYGMMIASGNDAAIALAEMNAGSVELFIKKMNQKAAQLGLKNTHFSNPMGFDNVNNYSTAQDLAILSMHVIENETLMNAAKLDEATIQSASSIEHKYVSTNKLLTENIGISTLAIEGLKTGTTPEAKECLITLARDESGKRFMTIVLGSDDRFQDTKRLIHWIYNNYNW